MHAKVAVWYRSTENAIAVHCATRSFGFSSLREVEISLVCDATETHLLIELDRAFRGDGYRAFSIANNASAGEVLTQLKPNGDSCLKGNFF
ncbi:sporulation protein [Shewanella sp. FJAT-52076]|uniref:sporulation protein n=1 Tax=Shewanella sp. FJAT-52076 TaxID=2864202 RepID=UPI001C656D39|nr:sporulation protein [Shewanella sp. FJAT-52076]QYJ74611.1 sporulation protein [Shewanella sp. FJAT-52076]